MLTWINLNILSYGAGTPSTTLEHVIIDLYQRGVRHYKAGGAMGFDTLAARTILKLRKEYLDMELSLVLPCLTQTRRWPAEDVEEYERIKAQADNVVYTSQEYTKGCMFKRNRYLVNNSSICICYLILISNKK